jgi:hypothetical protein
MKIIMRSMLVVAVLAAAPLFGSQIILAADPVPKFNIGPVCRSAVAATATATTTRDAAACERDENSARAAIEQGWSQFSAEQRSHCVRLSSLGGSPSYVELLTCLEMAKGAEKIPAAERMDTGDKVEKSRDAK